MTELHATSGNYVSFSHRLLWLSVERHLHLADDHKEDSWYLHLSAGLLAAAAFEAYLNYLGEELIPNVWAQERDLFSKEPYRGTNGKLIRIAEEIGLKLPRKDKQPYSGFSELQALRDKMVHARPHRTKYRTVHRPEVLPKFPSHWLKREAPSKRIRANINHIEELAVLIHTAIMQSKYRHGVFGSHPFRGLLGLGTHSVAKA